MMVILFFLCIDRMIGVVLLLLSVGGNFMIRQIGVRQTINHVSILSSDHSPRSVGPSISWRFQ